MKRSPSPSNTQTIAPLDDVRAHPSAVSISLGNSRARRPQDSQPSQTQDRKVVSPRQKSETQNSISTRRSNWGDEEAWLYREEMRDIWDGTSGAMAWLKKNIAAEKK